MFYSKNEYVNRIKRWKEMYLEKDCVNCLGMEIISFNPSTMNGIAYCHKGSCEKWNT